MNEPMRTVNAESAIAPPRDAIWEYGESGWEYAIRSQPKPPNGKWLRTSSTIINMSE